jgi:hypothetical protein
MLCRLIGIADKHPTERDESFDRSFANLGGSPDNLPSVTGS